MVAHRLLNEKEKRRIKIKRNNKNEQKGIWLKDVPGLYHQSLKHFKKTKDVAKRITSQNQNKQNGK